MDALAREYCVITFSLCDERSGHPDAGSPMDVFASQVAFALDRTHTERAPIVGVSFGGLVAALCRDASGSVHRRSPSSRRLVRSGICVHATTFTRASRGSWSGCFGGIAVPVCREVAAALPDPAARRRYLREQLKTVVSAPVSLSIRPLARVSSAATTACPIARA